MSIAFGGDGNSRGSSAVSPDRPGRAKGMWLGVDDVVEGALAQAPEVEHTTSRGGHKQVKQVSHPILACLPSIRSHKYLLAKNKQVLVFT